MSKTSIQVQPLDHRGSRYLKIISPNTTVAKQHIRSIAGRKWSQTHRCWYVPWTVVHLNQLIDLFSVQNEVSIKKIFFENAIKREQVSISKISQKQEIPNPWNKNQNKNISLPVLKTDARGVNFVAGNKCVLYPHNEYHFRVYIPFDKKGWIATIKLIAGRQWQAEEKYWLLPNVKDSYRILWSEIGKEWIDLRFRINPNIAESHVIVRKENPKKRVLRSLTKMQQLAVTKLEEKLLLEGKRQQTIKSYRNCLIGLFYFYPNAIPSKLSRTELETYIVQKKKKDQISDSYHNQIVNTLNAFYGRLLGQKAKILKIDRPKRREKLPNVLSEKEIEYLLNAVHNLKHKCMLLLIYSAGLRKGELLRLRVRDLNVYRKCIFVKDTKGGKDRYTFLSDIAQNYLKEYKKQYKPKYWLFEGQTGNQYSASSLQSIFCQARQLSGVNPYVTIHGLRHSFATHLVERGVPLHVVRELLGHSNIKTTEIYLHISNKYRRELKSPLDNLKV